MLVMLMENQHTMFMEAKDIMQLEQNGGKIR